MRPHQWLFQYKIIKKHKKADFEESLLLNDLLAQDMDLASLITNNKASQEYIQIKEKYRANRRKALDGSSIIGDTGVAKQDSQGKDVTIDNMDIRNEKDIKEVMEKYYDTAPATMTLPKHISEKHRFAGKTFSKADLAKKKERRRFIKLDDNPGEEPVAETKAESLPPVKLTRRAGSKKPTNIDLSEDGDK